MSCDDAIIIVRFCSSKVLSTRLGAFIPLKSSYYILPNNKNTMSVRLVSKMAVRQRQLWHGARRFSTVASTEHHVNHDTTTIVSPITRFTEDEEMARDMVRQWTDQELRPIVREMDNEAKLRPEILESLFQCGFMGMVRRSCLCSIGIKATDI